MRAVCSTTALALTCRFHGPSFYSCADHGILMTANLPADLDADEVNRIVDAAIAEDLGKGDITSRAVIPEETGFEGVMAAREPVVVAGLGIAELVFEKLSPGISFEALVAEGEAVETGTALARISGPAGELLAAERTAINFIQHLSGIATLTRVYAEAIASENAVLLDTRKTIPGLRQLEKYATRMGGATNHRMRLDDGVLIKDNHVAVAGGIGEAVRRALDAGLKHVEVECDTLEQVAEAAESGAERILLDNMSPDDMRRAIEIIDNRCTTEASGNVTLDNIKAVAASGVDYVSVGRLTHSAPSANIGLDWTPAA